jgi:hypothetical protein
MSCPKTQHLLQEYFADDLAPFASSEMEKHLGQCEFCHAELDSLLLVKSNLRQWQDQDIPHWDRGVELFRREHQATGQTTGFWGRLQWFPTAVSFAMLCILLFNVSVVSSDQGMSISFGAPSTAVPNIQSQLLALQASQREEMQSLITRVEDRQDRNNVQLLQAVMEQTQQSTAENLDRINAYFEERRLQDLQDMRVGYQQLVDSDYETIRSLEQLAQFVSFQGDVR